MKIFYCDRFVLPLPEDHRFPMPKYRLLRERVQGSPLALAHELHVPDAATDEQLLRVHDRGYLEKVKAGTLSRAEIRRIGFPWSPELVERSRGSTGATIAACRAALTEGIGVNLAGGTHHASRQRGEGFCVFNDSAVAARAMQAEVGVGRVAIIDCDVHQGNGTASIFADDPTVYTFSIHGANNYPFVKPIGDLDIALPDGTGDEAYLEALETGLEVVLNESKPDLAIYLAGADPYVLDTLGRLSLTRGGLAARDELVMGTLRSKAIPVATVMAGGYARAVSEIVDIHFQTVTIAAAMGVNAAGRSSRWRGHPTNAKKGARGGALPQ